MKTDSSTCSLLPPNPSNNQENVQDAAVALKPIKQRKTRWLSFWVNIILPLNLLFSGYSLFKEFGFISLIMFFLPLVSFVGLKFRTFWGWTTNMIFVIITLAVIPAHNIITLDYFGYTRFYAKELVDTGGSSLPFALTHASLWLPPVLIIFFILLANWVYFWKRKHLFLNLNEINGLIDASQISESIKEMQQGGSWSRIILPQRKYAGGRCELGCRKTIRWLELCYELKKDNAITGLLCSACWNKKNNMRSQ